MTMSYQPEIFVGGIRKVYIFLRSQLSKTRIKTFLKNNRYIWLEIGSGNPGKNGWITLDISGNCDIFCDVRYGLPFPDGSVSRIYSSHFLEHLTFRDGLKFLVECRRVLRPLGTFSICVPNARLYIDAYLNGCSLDADKYLPAFNNTTKIDYINYMAYMDGHHKYMFDEENLLFILKLAGFENACIRKFDPHIDLEQRKFESIYAEVMILPTTEAHP